MCGGGLPRPLVDCPTHWVVLNLFTFVFFLFHNQIKKKHSREICYETPKSDYVIYGWPLIVTTSFLFRLAYSIYNGKHIPCPQRESLMSPTVSQSMTEWSDCTRKQIDAMYDRREEKGENCFFTWPMSLYLTLDNKNVKYGFYKSLYSVQCTHYICMYTYIYSRWR